MSWGFSPTFDPMNIGRFILVKYLKWEAIVLTCWGIGDPTSRFIYVVIAWNWVVMILSWEVLHWAKLRKDDLFSPSVIGGGLTGTWSPNRRFFSGGTLLPYGGAWLSWGGGLALEISSLTLHAAALLVFIPTYNHNMRFRWKEHIDLRH